MENRKLIIYILVGVTGGLAMTIPFWGLTYNENTTHPALTQEIIRLYNANFPDRKISNADTELVIKGSVEEDHPQERSLRHFYDPLNKTGLGVWKSSLTWAHNSSAQATAELADWPARTLYGRLKDSFSGETDYSWERAVYEYAWGNKKRGLESLGHTLHLLEDLSVPDHTRNDPHAEWGNFANQRLFGVLPVSLITELNSDQSPYEKFTERFNRNTTSTFQEVQNEKPITFDSLDDHFEKLAAYSNNNFFSEDTILKDYNLPKITNERRIMLKDNVEYIFGTQNNGNKKILLAKIGEEINPKTGKREKIYTIRDSDNLILTDYWNHLSKQAVLHGAGVVKLFFDEVEKEKQTKILYNQNKSWLTRQKERFFAGMFGVTKTLYGSSVKLSDLEESGAIIGSVSESADISFASQTSIPEPIVQKTVTASETTQTLKTNDTIFAESSREQLVVKSDTPDIPPPSPETQPASSIPSSNTSGIVPIPGGAGSPPSSSGASSGDTTPPAAPAISSPSENYISSSTSLTFSGSAEVAAVVSNSFSGVTASVSNAGAWVLNLTGLLQGTSTINFFAKDTANNQSSASSRTVFIDSLAPDVTLTVAECGSSLSPDTCLVATSSVSISWSSSAGDLNHYIVSCELSGTSCSGFPSLSSTISTTTPYTLATDGGTYTFSARAGDIYNNISSAQTKTVKYISRPLVINEIAWAGTSAGRPSDEWIELYNPSSQTLNLAGIKLTSETDSGPDIALSGTLGSKAYYLIERTDDNTISNINASTTSSFVNGLNNAGEKLALKLGSTFLDRTPDVSTCGGWCAGSDGTYATMERFDPTSSGEASTNWGSFQGFLGTGKNADNEDISGTPGKRNSLNYLLSVTGSSLPQNKTLTAAGGPYLISASPFTVGSGKTLTVEAGTVIKFYSQTSYLKINGTLNVQGTSGSPVVFTSYKDDAYGGDTNNDGSATSPAAGNWGTIKIVAEGSTLNRALIRYGGFDINGNGDTVANLLVENSSLTLSNTTLEYSGTYGLRLKNSTSTIDSNIIRHNAANSSSAGIYLSGGNPTISNNTFTDNYFGISSLNGAYGYAVTSNSFASSTDYALTAISGYPTLSGNTTSNNGYNGINIQGVLNQDHSLSTNLPYIIATTFNVQAGKNLTIPSGVIIKFTNTGAISSSGKILANGTSGSPVVFTSYKDDTYGGDTNNNASATSPAAGDWTNITFSTSAASSTLNNVVVRYGGKDDPFASKGALYINSTSIDILSSTIENNRSYGIFLNNSTSTSITSSVIRNHTLPENNSYGLWLVNSTTTVQNTTFSGNFTGAFGDGTSIIHDGGLTNTFSGNTTNTTPANLVQP